MQMTRVGLEPTTTRFVLQSATTAFQFLEAPVAQWQRSRDQIQRSWVRVLLGSFAFSQIISNNATLYFWLAGPTPDRKGVHSINLVRWYAATRVYDVSVKFHRIRCEISETAFSQRWVQIFAVIEKCQRKMRYLCTDSYTMLNIISRELI